MSNNIDSIAIQNQLQLQFQIHLSIENTEELVFLIHSGKIQKAVNKLAEERLEIVEIKNILDFIKNVIANTNNIKEESNAIILDDQQQIKQSTIIDVTNIKSIGNSKENKKNFFEKFNLKKIKSFIFKFKTNDIKSLSTEFRTIKEIENFDLFVATAIQSFIEKERDHCTLNTVKNHYFELDFFDKKLIILFKKIKSAYLQNKDISRIQLSGNFKLPSGHLFIPIGVDLSNEIFVFWNPNGFIERFEQNKNTSFYSSFEKQAQARISGIIEHKLSNETIYISDFHNFHKQLLLIINSVKENTLLKVNSQSTIYTINNKYCDKLNIKNNSDQISNWLSTETEKSNNKNPFNNYRGIRTLEFQNRNDIPAFFLFVTTLSKRKDDSANIWSDKYNDVSGHLSYHGDAKPGRELYNSQNHGNCRLKKVNHMTKTQGLIPPVIYFIKTRKGEMEFKGIFKVLKIEEFDDVANGNIFRNLKIQLKRDLEITNIKPSEIVSIRVLGINNLHLHEWYIRNCAKL